MTSMEAFIHYENLIILKRRLADPSISDEQRQMLTRLVALEQTRDVHAAEDSHTETSTLPTGLMP